jgi:hypothetical protein
MHSSSAIARRGELSNGKASEQRTAAKASRYVRMSSVILFDNWSELLKHFSSRPEELHRTAVNSNQNKKDTPEREKTVRFNGIDCK